VTLRVLAPCPGRVLPIDQTPDPVFAGKRLGPGVLLDPEPAPTTVFSPVAGTLLKIHPHAFVVLTQDGVGILVHLGIDTVRLEGRGFEVLATEKSALAAGDPVIRWDPATVATHGLSNAVPVVAMEQPAGSVAPPAPGRVVTAGDELFVLG
jgi:glucose-specific phosphotransferase system IIA component